MGGGITAQRWPFAVNEHKYFGSKNNRPEIRDSRFAATYLSLAYNPRALRFWGKPTDTGFERRMVIDAVRENFSNKNGGSLDERVEVVPKVSEHWGRCHSKCTWRDLNPQPSVPKTDALSN